MTCSRCGQDGANASTLCAGCLTADAHDSAERQGLGPEVDEVAAERIASILRPYDTAQVAS